MKKFLIIIFGFHFSVQIASAQGENASLLLQSPHGRMVKMIWFFKSWEKEIKGFDIRRKEGLQKQWVQLNKEAIVPSISLKKDLTNVESDKAEAIRIKSVAVKYLADHKITEMDTDIFLRKVNSDDQFLRNFSKMISEDYDIALMSGFAFVDHNASKKIDYQYGLFIHGTDVLLAHAGWNYGEIPDLNVITDITTKSVFKKSGIQIIWNVDQKKLKAAYVHGFNIYRDGIRLNQEPIMIAYNNDLSEFEWFDSTANSDIPNQYSIGSESLLDIEGIIKPYTYNPADHPEIYAKAEITEISSLGYYFKEGIHVSWGFPKEYDHFINGFYVEKDNLPQGYKQVSQILDPSIRECVDKTVSPVGSYVRFRVVAIYKDRSVVHSADRVYSYFPIRAPPPPLNLRAKTELNQKVLTVNFSWDPPMHGDTLTDYYHLYSYDPFSNRLLLNTRIPPIKANKLNYEITDLKAGNYKFCISSIGKYGSESPLSDTVVVSVPTLLLPKPVIMKTSMNENAIVIEWQYPEITDLKGFRIYKDKQLIANEDVIDKNMREFTIPSLKWNSNYEFTIQAISTSNITSDVSNIMHVAMPPAPKKRK